MKRLTIKALSIAAIAALSFNVQASYYDDCVADGNNIIQIGKTEGAAAAEAHEQKTTLVQCFRELEKIEAKYGDKTKGLNPSSVMTPEDRKKWAVLFDAISAKQFRGVPYLRGVYYRGRGL